MDKKKCKKQILGWIFFQQDKKKKLKWKFRHLPRMV